MSSMNPIIETGFARALAEGMGMGLHARQLRAMQLYRDQMLQDRERRLENDRDRLGLYAQNIGSLADARSRGLDMRERSLTDREGDPAANAAMTGYLVGNEPAPEPTTDLYGPDQMGPPEQASNPEFQSFAHSMAQARPDIRHAVASRLISEGKADRVQKMLHAIASDPNLPDAQKYNSIIDQMGGDPGVAKMVAGRMLGPAKPQPQFTPDMVKAMYPTLPDERVAAVADASNQAGKMLRPTGIVLSPSTKPSREEAEARAADIMRGSGIEDPESHPAFGLMAYKIQEGKDIDQKTADRMFGNDPAVAQKIMLNAYGAKARDATELEKAANMAVAQWMRTYGTTTAVPPDLLSKQRAAHAASVDAHNRWEEAMAPFTTAAPRPVQQPSPRPAPVQPQGAPPIRVNPAALNPAPAQSAAPPASATPAAPVDPLEAIKARLGPAFDPTPEEKAAGEAGKAAWKARIRAMMQQPAAPAGVP